MPGHLRVYIACSLDGFIAGEGDDLSWLPEDDVAHPEEDMGYERFIGEVGALLMGRRTYDVVRGFDVEWPYGDRPVIVATRRPLDADPPPSVEASQGSIEELAERALARAGGRDVWVDGGDLIRQALDAGLIEELVVTLIPVVLGRGYPLFAGVEQRQRFEVVDTESFAGPVQITLRPV